jgi:hypothetical protein
MTVRTYIYGNTGNIEDDIDWSFESGHVLLKGMKLRVDGIVYIITDAVEDMDTGDLEIVLEKIS